MRVKKHLDEAREAATASIRSIKASRDDVERAAILDDLFGRISVAVWARASADDAALRDAIDARMREECAQYWTGDIWFAEGAAPEDKALYDHLWDEGIPIDKDDKLRLNDRHRNRIAWFRSVKNTNPLWPGGPPLVVFHSVKGGMGRTTALAAYAMARARRGERVAVVDFDLDAPGIGRLLDSDGAGTTARWGVIDFLLEARYDLPLGDYMHTCARSSVTGEGLIEVFSAGRLDNSFLTKLSRVDLEVSRDIRTHPLFRLLQRIRDERQPSIILLDCRAGLSPAAGLLLSGMAHLHVLFGSTNAQSLDGLERVVRHLGYAQSSRMLPQAECLVVHAMVPDNAKVGEEARATFAARVEDIFRYGYYAEASDEENRVWSLEDLASRVAPHVPIPLPYRGEYAFFDSVDQIADPIMRDPAYAPTNFPPELQDSRVSLCDRLDDKLMSIITKEGADA
jgi:cellulose biosynthesis protein BcsQ